MKDDRIYLEHILECIARIEQYTHAGRDGFLSSTIVQDATLRNLQKMAESTQCLDDSLKARHPEVDWRALSGFRNVVAHDYLGIDLELVWQAIEEQMPGLRVAAESLLASPSREG